MIKPLVSIVIPCYNRSGYVREAIDSALAQTWPATEIIAVDDGSTDNTASVLAEYQDRIHVIRQTNGGVAAARNTGIAASKGEWVAFLDSDDSWLTEKLEAQMALAQEWPDAVLIHTLCSTMDPSGAPIDDGELSLPDRLEEHPLRMLLGHCYPTTSSVMIKRDVLSAVGSFDADFEQNGGFAAEDWELYLRVAEMGRFARVSRKLTRYRVHKDSKTLSDKLPHTVGLINLRRRIDLKLTKWSSQDKSAEMDAAIAGHKHGFAHVYGRLGLIYRSRREFSEAKEAFEQAIGIQPYQIKHRLRYAQASLLDFLVRRRSVQANAR